MNNDRNRIEDDVMEILEGYAAATPEGNDHELLRQWIERHPDYAQDLIEFAVSRDLVNEFEDASFTDDTEKMRYVARAREIFRNYMATQSAPLVGIIVRAEELQLKKKDLMERLGISPELLAYLDQRAIEYASIPKTFVQRLAHTLDSSVESVAAFLRQDINPAQAFHKSSGRPEELVKQDFTTVVRNDINLSDEQKDSLISN